MANRDIAREWFVPGEGIDRRVISTDIQRYLGNDATVRPGRNEGVDGFWIKAYRNLTSAMIADLRRDTARWMAEQRAGTRGDYAQSSTYRDANAAGRGDHRRESPSVEGGPYGVPPPPARDRDHRMPPGRMPPTDRMAGDRMDIDPPQPPPDGRRYGPSDRVYAPNGRGYPDRPGYVPDARPSYPPQDHMAGQYPRPPVTGPYPPDNRYATAFPTQPNDGAPPGYVRQGNFFVPVTSGYEPGPPIQTRADPPPLFPSAPGPYGQAPPNRDPYDPRDARDPRDTRYGPPQPEYVDPRDPRYAYPSPANTISIPDRDPRDALSSPPQPSFGVPQYDLHGRPIIPSPGQPDRIVPPMRETDYGRDRDREHDRERERDRDRERERDRDHDRGAGGASDGQRHNRRRLQ